MAQSAGRSENRHGFIFKRTYPNTFGKITGMATTTRGNLLVCDNKEKMLVLLSPEGDYLCDIKLDCSPYDIDISQTNKCIVTAPSDERFLHLDPDQLVILQVEMPPKFHYDTGAWKEVYVKANLVSVSATEKDCFFMYTMGGIAYLYHIWPTGFGRNKLGLSASKIKALAYTIDNAPPIPINETFEGIQKARPRLVNEIYAVTCKENKILKFDYDIDTSGRVYKPLEQINVSIPSIDGITDICIDDNHHIYLTGLYSHTVHRLTEDGSVLDIPLTQTNTQGLKSPTAITFNQSYTKLYVATEWGKRVLVFYVV